VRKTVALLNSGVELPTTFATMAEGIDTMCAMRAQFAEQLQGIVMAPLLNINGAEALLSKLEQQAPEVSDAQAYASMESKWAVSPDLNS